MTQEEAVVRLGIDSSGIDRQQRVAGDKVESFMEHLTKRIGLKFNHVLQGLLGVDLVMHLHRGIEEFIGWMSEKWSSAIFNVEGTKAEGELLEKRRLMLRGMMKEQEADQKLEAQENKKEDDRENKAKKESHELEKKIAFDQKDTLGKISDLNRQVEYYKRAIADEDKRGAEYEEDRLALMKAESELSKLNAQFHKEGMDAAETRDAAANKVSESKRKLISPLLGAHIAELNQIAALEQDASESQRFNPRRAAVGRRIADDMKRQLISGLNGQLNTPQTPADKAMNEILQLMAPIKDSGKGIPVEVTNTD